MPPRRTHTKSRNGCSKCKKRRVKCDEVHPACGNCIKHAIECDFSSIQVDDGINIQSPGSVSASDCPIVSLSPSTLRSNISSPSHHSSPSPFSSNGPTLQSVSAFFPQQQRQALPPPPGGFGWSMEDMELMHHFTLAGPGFLSGCEEIRCMWREVVPKLAFSDKYGCALHSILGVASLHLALLEPANRSMRLIKATAHYDQAVRIITVMISNICKDNCEALFISSTLIVVFATGSALLPGNTSPASENEAWSLPEWIPLIRGVVSILKEAWVWVQTGCLAPILKVHLYDGPNLLPENTTKALNNLYRLCTDVSEPEPEEIKDTETSSTYFAAIHELQKSFANSADLGTSAVSLMFLWPILVSDKYVVLLKDRRARALIIFAHYCALLKSTEVHWWVEGRSEYELVRIERSIQDLEKWHKWLEWPTKMVRGEVQA